MDFKYETSKFFFTGTEIVKRFKSVIFCCEKEYKKQKKRKRVKRTLLRTLIFEDQIIKINYNLLSAFLIKLSTVIP